MSELLRFDLPRRVALLLAATLMAGAPASGQGPMPPVPGPFPVAPLAGRALQVPQMPMPAMPAVRDIPERAAPIFQAPAGAMRLPYWMQTPTPRAAEAREVASGAPQTSSQANTPQHSPTRQATPTAGRSAPEPPIRTAPSYPVYRQGTAPTGYMQPMPFWGVPSVPMAPGYGTQGYGVQAPGWAGQAPAGPAQGIVPAYVQPPVAVAPQSGNSAAGQTAAWPAQPWWGYGSGPFWAPAPFAAAPGWGQGWGAPVNGAGN